jgi:hypothetical protein
MNRVRSRRRSARVLVVMAMAAAFALAFALTPPPGPRSLRQFDADRLASLETQMWQAYYRKERARLFGLLVTLLHEQYQYSWATAAVEGFHLARAASRFGDLRDHYEVVLPDLEAAYGKVRSWTGANFDPRSVARAELAWWEACRIPGRNSPEQVGALIAEEYALLYESSPPAMAAAALLRAQAAAMRDASAERPDWDAIGHLLRDSYRELRLALASANV